MTVRQRHSRLIQFLKYNVGGIVYFVSGYIVFAICYSLLGLVWWQAKLFGDLAGLSFNYILQRYWAFTSGELERHEGRNRGRYSLWSAGNLALDYVIIGGLRALGITPYIGMFAAAGFFTVWNYIGYRFWVFKAGYNKP